MDYELEIDGKKLTLPDCNLKPKFEVAQEEPPPPAKKARAARAGRVRRNPVMVTAAAPQVDIDLPPIPPGTLIPTPFNEEMIQQMQAWQQTPNGGVLPTGIGILGMLGAVIAPALLGTFGTFLKK
jgi:hypothetical protein